MTTTWDRTHRDRSYRRVAPTEAELAAFAKTHNGCRPNVYRVVCLRCGQRLWFSGMGKGAHERGRRHAESARTVSYAELTRRIAEGWTPEEER